MVLLRKFRIREKCEKLPSRRLVVPAEMAARQAAYDFGPFRSKVHAQEEAVRRAVQEAFSAPANEPMRDGIVGRNNLAL